MMKRIRRIWDYFFSKRSEEPPFPEIREKKKTVERHEVKFFEPVSIKDKFDKSDSLKDFIKKIETHE